MDEDRKKFSEDTAHFLRTVEGELVWYINNHNFNKTEKKQLNNILETVKDKQFIYGL